MNTLTSAALVAVMALVTIALRFLPFWVFRKRVPPVILYLGKVLPPAIMGMLVIYCLRDTAFTAPAAWLPALLATAAVVGTHVWKRNTLLSIVLGTAVYMALIRVLA